MQAVNDRAIIGDNKPPHVAALDNAQDLAFDCSILVVNSPEAAAAAALLIDRETKARNEAEKLRKAEKEPYLEEGRKIDAAWKPVVETLQKAIDPVKRQILDWNAKERARRLKEAEDARLEAERLNEIAMAKMAAEGQGDNGASAEEVQAAINEANAASAEVFDKDEAAKINRIEADGIRARGIKTVWSAEITDPVALVIALANNPEVQDAAIKVANSMARTMKGAFVLNGAKPVSRETL